MANLIGEARCEIFSSVCSGARASVARRSAFQRRRDCQPARRGQRRGAPSGPLSARAIGTVGAPLLQCPACGEFLDEFPLRGQRGVGVALKATCSMSACVATVIARPAIAAAPGIVSPVPAARARQVRPLGVGCRAARQVPVRQTEPSLPHDLCHHGLDMSSGTLRVACRRAPMMAVVVDASSIEQHWHADETRWAVFAPVVGKTPSVVSAGLSLAFGRALRARPSRPRSSKTSWARWRAASPAATVTRRTRSLPGCIRRSCWRFAGRTSRRDLLELGNAYPLMLEWAMVWVDAIAQLCLSMIYAVASRERAIHRARHRTARGDRMADQRAPR